MSETAETENAMTTFSTSREIPATLEQVFAAFRHPERLSRWWGPAGFTNTFSVFEFTNGGRWSFIMHGPNGGNYRNESLFAEIEPLRKVVIEHVSKPKYRLTISFTSSPVGTVVSWSQAFESSEVATRIEHIVVPPTSRISIASPLRFFAIHAPANKTSAAKPSLHSLSTTP